MMVKKNNFVIVGVLVALLAFGIALANTPNELEEKLAPNAVEKTYPPVTLRHGGPDPGGYYYIDSDDDAMNKPVYNWIDISSIGTPISFPNGTSTRPLDDRWSNPIPFGRNFVFYGNSYSSAIVSTNGFITFASSLTSSYLSNTTIPSTSLPNDFIAFEWDDLDGTGDGAAYSYYDAAENRFIISLHNWAYYADTSRAARHNMQVILDFDDNSIVCQYGPIGGAYRTSSTVGIENSTGTIGTQYLYNQAGLRGQFAVYFGLQGPIFGTHNVGPDRIVSPGMYGRVGTPVTPQVVYRNMGQATESFRVRFMVKEGATIVYNETAQINNLPSNQTATATFPDFTPAHETIYDLIAISELIGDENPLNDTLRGRFQAFANIAYYDFESNGVFTPSGCWEWGIPTSGPGNAHSGVNVWATVLGGNYPNSSMSSLVTPPFGLGPNAVLSFWHWYDTESGYDGCNVKISTDNGATWALLHPINGYDRLANSSNPLYPDSIFSGHDIGAVWTNEPFDLSAYAGQSVIFRLDFGSDASVVYPGWYVDDFAVLGGGGVEPGWITGTVRTHGTGAPINGAIVSLGGTADTTGPDGIYWLSAFPGTYTVTAQARYHNPASAQVTVQQGDTTIQNFSLTAPMIQVNTTPIIDSVRIGTTRNYTRPMSNTGTGPLDYTIRLNYSRALRITPGSNPWYTPSLEGAADVSESRGTGTPPMVTTLGDTVFWFDSEVSSGDNGCLGIEFDGTYFWVTGRNASGGDVHKLHKFDANGNYIQSFNQGTTSTWGWRDLAFDGQFLYASDENELAKINPATGQKVGTLPMPAGFTPPCRGLAYDPSSDCFWTANFSSNIVKFNRQGQILAQYPNTLSIYGLAWDNASQGGPFLWVWSQDGTPAILASQFNPATGSYTGVSFMGVLPPGYTDAIAGGACFTTAWDPSLGILFTMNQGTPADFVMGYEICPHSTWIRVSPTSGTIQPGGSTDLVITIDLTHSSVRPDTIYHATVIIENNSSVTPQIPVTIDVITGINDAVTVLPADYALLQNYPNPFNARTEIIFALPKDSDVDLSVYNLMGQKVATLVSGRLSAGFHKVNWDASGVSSGVYFYKLNAGEVTKVQQMTLVK